MKRSQKYVQKTTDAILGFNDPFSVETDQLVVLSSGAIVPEEVTSDVLRAEIVGKEAKDEFVKSIRNIPGLLQTHKMSKLEDYGQA